MHKLLGTMHVYVILTLPNLLRQLLLHVLSKTLIMQVLLLLLQSVEVLLFNAPLYHLLGKHLMLHL